MKYHFSLPAYLFLTAIPVSAAEIRELTGAQTRVVWVQDAGETARTNSERPTLRLMGFDTDDGKSERPILPAIGWYAKPQLTADGQRVVFADWADYSVNVVNFDGINSSSQNQFKFSDKLTETYLPLGHWQNSLPED